MVGRPNFTDQFKKIIKRHKKLDITWISCDSLHTWFIAMVSSLIYGWSGLRLNDGSDVKR